jgi:hypothetical protein
MVNRAQLSRTAAAGARRLEENAYVLPRPRAAVGLASGCLALDPNAVSGPRANATTRVGLSLDDREPDGSR